MKKMKCKEYKPIKNKRSRRLNKLLATKKVVYCRNEKTAYNSILSIFNISEHQLNSFIDNFSSHQNPVNNDEYLDALLKYIKHSTPPEFDGAIYFHNTRTPAKEFFKYGISSRDTREFEMRILKIFRNSPKAIETLSSIKNWNYSVFDDLALCGTMLFSQEEVRKQYHMRPPEGFLDMISDVDDNNFLFKSYMNSTCCKIVSFYSENIELRLESLNKLIGYVLKCNNKIGLNYEDLDIGYNGSGITAKHILVVNLADEPTKNEDQQKVKDNEETNNWPSPIWIPDKKPLSPHTAIKNIKKTVDE
jgi:hypothetical protein